jgi:hypothetical protein
MIVAKHSTIVLCLFFYFFSDENANAKTKTQKNNWCWKCININTKIDGDKNALMQDTLNKGLGTYLLS